MSDLSIAPQSALAGLAILLGLTLGLTAAILLAAMRRRRRRAAAGLVLRPPLGTATARAGPTEGLRAALGRTRALLTRAVMGQRPEAAAGERWAAIEEALLLADVGVRTTASLLARLKAEAASGSPSDGVLLGLLRRVLVDVFASGCSASEGGRESERGPTVILVTGVNGVGKTTTIGKLAARHAKEGRRVLLVAADTFRAAATEQLERWGARTGASVVSQQSGADPAAVVVDGLRSAKSRGSDVVIIDTAGRLHTKANLMEELRKIRRVTERECPGAPHETLLVLDATTGQNGLEQARLFNEAVGVSGIVLTKLDGTARGGIAVAVAVELGVPIRFVGIGEGVDDLRPFQAEEFVDALLLPDAEAPLNRTA